MPRTHAEFTAFWRQNDPDPLKQLWAKRSTLRTTDRKLFDALTKSAKKLSKRGKSARADFSVTYPSENFDSICQILESRGVCMTLPSPQAIGKEGMLFPHYQRIYNKEELDCFPFFTIADTKNIIGNYHSKDSLECPIVEAGTVDKIIPFGILHPFNAVAFSDPLKISIEALQPRGTLFREIWDEKGDFSELWQLWSSVTMPECLLPRIDSEFRIVSDPDESAFFFDSGFQPPLLKFDRLKTESLGSFDVAVMQEISGPFGKNSDRKIVISNLFRRELNQLKVPGLRFDPVELS